VGHGSRREEYTTGSSVSSSTSVLARGALPLRKVPRLVKPMSSFPTPFHVITLTVYTLATLPIVQRCRFSAAGLAGIDACHSPMTAAEPRSTSPLSPSA